MPRAGVSEGWPPLSNQPLDFLARLNPLVFFRAAGGWQDVFSRLRFLDLIDIIIVAYVFYKLILLIRDTRAVQLLKGLIFILLAALAAEKLKLTATSWLLNRAVTAGLIAIPIIFHPELRRALEQLGRGRLFGKPVFVLGEESLAELIRHVGDATSRLGQRRIGALIVFERGTGLNEIVETGIFIDGDLSAEFLESIFNPRAPLHDGAVVVRGNRILAAGCYLPLTENPYLSKELGTRHRAALGISEQSDAVSVVVSEETGTISVAVGGKLIRYLNDKSLREMLSKLLVPVERGFSLKTRRSSG